MLDSHLAALEAIGLGQPYGLASAGLEQTRRVHATTMVAMNANHHRSWPGYATVAAERLNAADRTETRATKLLAPAAEIRCPAAATILWAARAASGCWWRHVRAGCPVETAGNALAALAVDGLRLLLVSRGLGGTEFAGERLTGLIETDRLYPSGSSQNHQGGGSGNGR